MSGEWQRIREVVLGWDVRIYDFVNLYGCKIGAESQIGPFVEIQRGAILGKRVKVQSHSFICRGVTIEDEVFIGHGVMFTNDKRPRVGAEWVCVPTLVKKGASIGSNVTVLCGVTIGEYAMVGAGSVVTHDVPAYAMVAGIPAVVMKGTSV